jgi:hypothetical protein
MSCTARLQRHDAETQRVMWGGESDRAIPSRPATHNGRKQILTQQDIVRNYAK